MHRQKNKEMLDRIWKACYYNNNSNNYCFIRLTNLPDAVRQKSRRKNAAKQSPASRHQDIGGSME